METRSVETAGFDPLSAPLGGIRWPAVFAGLAVGLSVYLLLMLIGIAAGFAVYGAGGRLAGSSLSFSAALGNTIGMFIAAMVGGYVAARASGLRRNVDGMLHGVVSWGAAILCFAVFTGSLTGNAVTGLFGMAVSTTISARGTDGPDSATVGELLASLERGDRPAAVDILRDRFGLSQEQAGRAADRALAMSGRASAASPEARSDVSGAAQTASAASAWLGAMVLLSLLAGAGGGLLGARGARQRALHGRYDEQRVVHTHGTRMPSPG